MTDPIRTEEEVLKPTLGENVRELFSRVAKLNDQMSAILAPEWGARMGILPEGHPLHPGAPEAEPEEQSAPVDWEAIARQRERELKQVGGARHRAEAELRRYTEAESADAAAGSYAGRAETVEAQLAQVRAVEPLTEADRGRDDGPREWADYMRGWNNARAEMLAALGSEEYAIAQPEPWLHILFTSPDPATANTSALALRDHLTAEFRGVGMRISSNAVEAGAPPICELPHMSVAEEDECEQDWLTAAVAGLAQALRLTREYVGADLLPAAEGWSWYDALRRWAPNELADAAPSCSPGGEETEPNNPAATEATDVGTEFVQQADHPDGAALDPWETDLAQSGVDTTGCDCGHHGMGPRWHAMECAWRAAKQPARTIPNNPPASENMPDNPLEEQIRAAIESEMYEYRERTMWWPEGGITGEIARLATRGAMEALGRKEQP